MVLAPWRAEQEEVGDLQGGEEGEGGGDRVLLGPLSWRVQCVTWDRGRVTSGLGGKEGSQWELLEAKPWGPTCLGQSCCFQVCGPLCWGSRKGPGSQGGGVWRAVSFAQGGSSQTSAQAHGAWTLDEGL